ncbi:hypothetical protein ACWCSD_51990 [Nonomuraea sp. NPDC001684]
MLCSPELQRKVRVPSPEESRLVQVAPTAVPDSAYQPVGAEPSVLTQVGLSVPDPARLIHDFWTTVYQAVDA